MRSTWVWLIVQGNSTKLHTLSRFVREPTTLLGTEAFVHEFRGELSYGSQLWQAGHICQENVGAHAFF